uniref:MbeD/MobD family mobilization/exclusion protein n=1 Tax=Escherichia coli TaxID=562 RepID=UPI002FBDE2CA
MTELERHLLNALEQLQQEYILGLADWEAAFVELQKLFTQYGGAPGSRPGPGHLG